MKLYNFFNTRSQSLYLAILGCVLLLTTSVSPIDQYIQHQRQSIITQIDSFTSIPLHVVERGTQLIKSSSIRSVHILEIEQKNRELYARLAACQRTVSQASGSATTQFHSTEPSTTTHLSFAGGRWIVLSGSADHQIVGNMVLMDGVFLGTLSTLHSTYSEIETVTTSSVPSLVQHEKSKVAAVLRSEKGVVLVQFSKRVGDIEPSDLFVTVPDGKHSRGAYPIATLEEIHSENTDSVSIVKVKPIAVPVIGAKVEILHSQE